MRKLRLVAIAVAAALLPLGASPASGNGGGPFTPVAVNDTVSRPITTIPAPVPYAEFGYALAVSGDTMVVGARKADSERGEVYVYSRSAGVWGATPVATITSPADAVLGATGRFGEAVAISGGTIVVGAPYVERPTGQTAAGEVYVFTGSGATWTQQATLLDPGQEDLLHDSRFGSAVAIEGDTVVVGAKGKYLNNDPSGDTRSTGAAFVFNRDGALWSPGVRLDIRSGWSAKDQEFGAAVALSSTTILVGAPGNSKAVNQTGKVAQYTLGGTPAVWSQGDDLPGPAALAVGDLFGFRIQLQPGNLLVAAPTTDPVFGFPAVPILYQYTGTPDSWGVPTATNAAAPGPYLAYAADSFFAGATELYAGFGTGLGPVPGRVEIWGAESPLSVGQGGSLAVPAPGVLQNDWTFGLLVEGWSQETVSLLTPPANGTVNLGADGGFTYTPVPSFAGTDSFVYQINALPPDAPSPRVAQEVVTATVTITVVAPTIYTLTYAAGANGSISGATTQNVVAGQNGTTVTAVPAAGATFVRWSDGLTSAARQELNVQANQAFTAEFALPIVPPPPPPGPQSLSVLASSASSRSKFKLTVLTTGCTGPFKFRVQRKKVSSAQAGSDETPPTVTWKYLKGSYKTSTKTNSKTINLPKGTYRAVVDGRCGYLGVTSNEVKLKR